MFLSLQEIRDNYREKAKEKLSYIFSSIPSFISTHNEKIYQDLDTNNKLIVLDTASGVSARQSVRIGVWDPYLVFDPTKVMVISKNNYFYSDQGLNITYFKRVTYWENKLQIIAEKIVTINDIVIYNDITVIVE